VIDQLVAPNAVVHDPCAPSPAAGPGADAPARAHNPVARALS
jgi:hypothetical protein